MTETYENLFLLESAVLVINDPPKNCLKCPLHILTLENAPLQIEKFSCAGHKGRGSINPDCDFLNDFDSYSKKTAPNCPLISKVIRIVRLKD